MKVGPARARRRKVPIDVDHQAGIVGGFEAHGPASSGWHNRGIGRNATIGGVQSRGRRHRLPCRPHGQKTQCPVWHDRDVKGIRRRSSRRHSTVVGFIRSGLNSNVADASSLKGRAAKIAWDSSIESGRSAAPHRVLAGVYAAAWGSRMANLSSGSGAHCEVVRITANETSDRNGACCSRYQYLARELVGN